MEIKEFKIESRSENFRTMKVSPIDLLAISGQVDFDNFEKTKLLVKFSLEHIEVQCGDKWFPIKTKDREVYFPTDIEEDMDSIQELTFWFVSNIITPAFTKSSE